MLDVNILFFLGSGSKEGHTMYLYRRKDVDPGLPTSRITKVNGNNVVLPYYFSLLGVSAFLFFLPLLFVDLCCRSCFSPFPPDRLTRFSLKG